MKHMIFVVLLAISMSMLQSVRAEAVWNQLEFEDRISGYEPQDNFPDDMRVAYERQKGVCPICGGTFAFEKMRGAHIRPWSKGGEARPENLQMLCADCNARKCFIS